MHSNVHFSFTLLSLSFSLACPSFIVTHCGLLFALFCFSSHCHAIQSFTSHSCRICHLPSHFQCLYLVRIQTGWSNMNIINKITLASNLELELYSVVKMKLIFALHNYIHFLKLISLCLLWAKIPILPGCHS